MVAVDCSGADAAPAPASAGTLSSCSDVMLAVTIDVFVIYALMYALTVVLTCNDCALRLQCIFSAGPGPGRQQDEWAEKLQKQPDV